MNRTAIAAIFLLAACAHTTTAPSAFRLSSTSFTEGATLADSTVLNGLDCHGANASPALQWSDAPAGTKSYALICDDYEARGGDGFIHWVAYNIPATTTSIAGNAGAAEPDLAEGGRHAYNDFLRRRYDGPCPPEGPPHKYRFTVYALDLDPIDDAGTPMTWRKLRFIIRGHVLAQASLTGLRGSSSSTAANAMQRYLDAASLDEASRTLAPDYRLWFGERKGAGLDRATSIAMLEWDYALHARHRVDSVEVRGNEVVARVHEDNDFSRLIGFPGWDATSTYVIDAEGRIASQVYVPKSGQPEWRPYLDEPLAWLRANRSEVLPRIFPDGKLAQSAEAAREWVEALQAWRAATGRPAV